MAADERVPRYRDAVDILCAEAARAAGEGLAGTGVQARIWLALEVPEPWDAKPIKSPSLATVRPRLAQWLAAVPDSRLQLIRKPGRERAGARTLFIGDVGAPSPWLVRLCLTDYDELNHLNLEAIAAGDEHPRAEAVHHPVHLVCTHGKRDRCCAKFGMPVFSAMAAAEPDQVWQTSHLGGHRFAATLVSLPVGMHYGRVDEVAGRRILADHARGTLTTLEAVRGRCSLAPAAQVAEVELRRACGFDGLEPLELIALQQLEQEWLVRFAVGSKRWLARVGSDSSSALRPASCGEADKGFGSLRLRSLAPEQA